MLRNSTVGSLSITQVLLHFTAVYKLLGEQERDEGGGKEGLLVGERGELSSSCHLLSLSLPVYSLDLLSEEQSVGFERS